MWLLLILVVESVAIVDPLDNDDVFQIVVEMKTVGLEREEEEKMVEEEDSSKCNLY